jgi:hypothetical protein
MTTKKEGNTNMGPILKTKDNKTHDLGNINVREATDKELEGLKNMTDDELLRASTSLDLFSIAESMRRLKNALHSEEKAIKWLTVVLIILTLILIGLGIKSLTY